MKRLFALAIAVAMCGLTTPTPGDASPSATPSSSATPLVTKSASPTPSATPAPNPQRGEAELSACADNIDSIWQAIQRYRNHNHGAYPADLAALIPKYERKAWQCPACKEDTYSLTYHSGNHKQGVIVCCRGSHHPTQKADYPRLDYKLGLLVKPGFTYQNPGGSAYPVPYVDDLLDQALVVAAKARPTRGSRKPQASADAYRSQGRKILKEISKYSLAPEQKALYNSIMLDIGK